MKSKINYLLFLRVLTFVLAFAESGIVVAQITKRRVEVIVTPERAGWVYKVGEQPEFLVSVTKDGMPVNDVKIIYELGPEQMPPEKKGELKLSKGSGTIKGLKSVRPGFQWCRVRVDIDGTSYSSFGTAAFDPQAIKAVTRMPEDFTSFWDKQKKALSEIPIDARLTLIPEQSTGAFNAYYVSLQNIAYNFEGRSRFYGVLTIPKAAGKYPALLNVPGAGARPYTADQRGNRNVITFTVGIHGVPVNMESHVYFEMMQGILNQYYLNKLDDREQYFYKRVFMGCVRSIDFIFSLPEFDGENLVVNGGSQGGALSIITASLDERVKFLAAYYPAMSDMAGYLNKGQAGGWPHMFKDFDAKAHPEWERVAAYYDVVNFARTLKVPGFYSWGFNDNICPPTSMYAAYNEIKAPKELSLYLETGHWTYPEQRAEFDNWIFSKIGK